MMIQFANYERFPVPNKKKLRAIISAFFCYSLFIVCRLPRFWDSLFWVMVFIAGIYFFFLNSVYKAALCKLKWYAGGSGSLF